MAPLFNYRFVARDANGAPASTPRAGGFRIEPITVEGPEQSNSVDWKSYELHALDSGVDMRVIFKYMPFAYRSTAVEAFAGEEEPRLLIADDAEAGITLFVWSNASDEALRALSSLDVDELTVRRPDQGKVRLVWHPSTGRWNIRGE